MGGRRATAALVALLLLVSALPLSATAAGPTLPPVLEKPPWAIGFFWTYHYAGPDAQSFGGFSSTSINDTYTSSIIGETTTARGDAWVERNYHQGTMGGNSPFGPGTADFTSETFYTIRKSDLAILNFTQDLNITAHINIIGDIHGRAHNETYAEPPLAEIAFGAPADGTPWRVYSNMTSEGWIQIVPAPPQNVSAYMLVDYNLSVGQTQSVTVPAGTFDAYNVSGFGTVDYNGTVYNYSETSLLSPKAQERVVDPAGYVLTSLFVNRPPSLSGALPPVRVTAGSFNDSLDASTYVVDPEGAALTFSACAAEAPAFCEISPAGQVNVSAPIGVNATLNATFSADDGAFSGNATFPFVILIRGPANPNLPPTYSGTALELDEDSELTVDVSTLFSDPEGDPVTVLYGGATSLYLVSQTGSVVALRPPVDYNGAAALTVTAYDTAGNSVDATLPVTVRPVNDAPDLLAIPPVSVSMHAGVGTQVFSVIVIDPDGPTSGVNWTIDGQSTAGVSSFSFSPPSTMAAGNHTLTAVADDGLLHSGSAEFTIFVFVGPKITANRPMLGTVRLANNTSGFFSVNVTDPDSSALHYNWTIDGALVRAGDGVDNLSYRFTSPGVHQLRVVVADNGTTDERQWQVAVEEAPPGLVQLLAPADGSTFEANTSVSVSGSVSSLIENATIEWRLDGVVFSTNLGASTGPLAPGNHTISLRVIGLYNGVVPYNVTLQSKVTVNAPPVNNTTSGGGNHTPPPGQFSIGSLWLVFVLSIAAAAAAVSVIVWRRRTRAQPPQEPPAA